MAEKWEEALAEVVVEDSMTMMMKISLLEEVASEAVEVATTTLMMRKDSRREIKDRPSEEEEAMVSQDHSEAVIEVASEKKEEVIKAEAVLEEKKEAALEVEEWMKKVASKVAVEVTEVEWTMRALAADPLEWTMSLRIDLSEVEVWVADPSEEEAVSEEVEMIKKLEINHSEEAIDHTEVEAEVVKWETDHSEVEVLMEKAEVLLVKAVVPQEVLSEVAEAVKAVPDSTDELSHLSHSSDLTIILIQ
jgi:hypothetical protein